ncbi:D-amino-acid transaminase [Paenibacillus koleovorans]|uniref:D-amino-acid transaminase n=1 Tax=Paenibacillus koleovorans TaxID=121608 RepID=UPI000FD80F13|nr:D-amino-acid transaminase [Paenibacillus koleovorans]
MSWMLQNERIIPRGDAALSYLDRGYCFGDGIYEVIRVYNGRMFESGPHYDRLKRSLREIKLELPNSIDKLNDYLEKLIEADKLDDGIVYLQVTRGVAPRAHAFPPAGTEPVLIAYTSEVSRPFETMHSGIAVITRPDIRWLRCDIKTLNLLPNVLAKQESVEVGSDDVVFHRDGTVTECTASNLLIVRDGSIITHPADNMILHGITRLVIRQLAQHLDIPFVEQPITVDEMMKADEVFLSSTISEVMPIVQIDGVNVGGGQPGPVVRRLQAAFERYAGLVSQG